MKNKSNYPENWLDEIRPRILKRDNFTCQHCGMKHRQKYLKNDKSHYIQIDSEEFFEAKEAGEKVVTCYLQVAHLDHNPQNNKEQNLLSLCSGCHLKNDLSVNLIKRNAKFKKLGL